MAVPALFEATQAKVYINKGDSKLANENERHKFSGGSELGYYEDGDVVSVGGLEFTVIATPGHSKGSVTLKCEDVLFTGDTLFKDSCGRTDLEGGSYETLMQSLKRLL
jgi:glyoxylase-like metal-dependent hydrolase (beta-lactamase superfamily II)